MILYMYIYIYIIYIILHIYNTSPCVPLSFQPFLAPGCPEGSVFRLFVTNKLQKVLDELDSNNDGQLSKARHGSRVQWVQLVPGNCSFGKSWYTKSIWRNHMENLKIGFWIAKIILYMVRWCWKYQQKTWYQRQEFTLWGRMPSLA